MVVYSDFYIISIELLWQIENSKKHQIFVGNSVTSCKQGTYEMKKNLLQNTLQKNLCSIVKNRLKYLLK